jgi:hypothetical protein
VAACFRRAQSRSSPASPAKSARFIANSGPRVALRFLGTTVFPVTEARSGRGLLRVRLLRRVRGHGVYAIPGDELEIHLLRVEDHHLAVYLRSFRAALVCVRVCVCVTTHSAQINCVSFSSDGTMRGRRLFLFLRNGKFHKARDHRIMT